MNTQADSLTIIDLDLPNVDKSNPRVTHASGTVRIKRESLTRDCETTYELRVGEWTEYPRFSVHLRGVGSYSDLICADHELTVYSYGNKEPVCMEFGKEVANDTEEARFMREIAERALAMCDQLPAEYC